MKKSLLAAVLATLTLSAPLAWAADAAPADKAKKPAMSMTDKDRHMQENMLKMHEQMHKIMEAKTPQDIEQHKQAHSKMMHDNMQMMHGMMGDHGKMGGDAKGGKMEGGKMEGGKMEGGKMEGGMKGKY